MKSRFIALCAGWLLLPAAVMAHHSFQATYDTEATVTIKGRLVQVMFRNPHSFIHVMAPDQNGAMQRWGVEWGGATLLQRQGITRETLKPGDELVITGQPGRNPADHRVRMQTLLRPVDGFGWGTGAGETFD